MTHVHPKFQPYCINYKTWKKTLNSFLKSGVAVEEVIRRLGFECERVEYIFKNEYTNRSLYREHIAPCFFPVLLENSREVHKFVCINKQCIRKLVKKINKFYKTSEMTLWYNNILAKYKFLNGKYLSRLRLELGLVDLQCPICLDEMKSPCILQCGHVMCEACIRKLMGIEHIHGTLKNVISSIPPREVVKCKCPICRVRIQL